MQKPEPLLAHRTRIACVLLSLPGLSLAQGALGVPPQGVPPQAVPTGPAAAASLPVPAASAATATPPAPVPTAAPTPAPTPPPAAPPAARISRAPLPPAPPPPPLRGLPADAPKLVVSGGIYSPDPALRRLIVNGNVVTEGADLGSGVKLEQIKPAAVVLGFRGKQYDLSY